MRSPNASSENLIMSRRSRLGSPTRCWRSIMNNLSELAYRIDPAQWVERELGFQPRDWQKQFLRTPRGAQVAVLTARQVGKTTAASWAIAHTMITAPGSLSVIACPAQ